MNLLSVLSENTISANLCIKKGKENKMKNVNELREKLSNNERIDNELLFGVLEDVMQTLEHFPECKLHITANRVDDDAGWDMDIKTFCQRFSKEIRSIGWNYPKEKLYSSFFLVDVLCRDEIFGTDGYTERGLYIKVDDEAGGGVFGILYIDEDLIQCDGFSFALDCLEEFARWDYGSIYSFLSRFWCDENRKAGEECDAVISDVLNSVHKQIEGLDEVSVQRARITRLEAESARKDFLLRGAISELLRWAHNYYGNTTMSRSDDSILTVLHQYGFTDEEIEEYRPEV